MDQCVAGGQRASQGIAPPWWNTRYGGGPLSGALSFLSAGAAVPATCWERSALVVAAVVNAGALIIADSVDSGSAGRWKAESSGHNPSG